MPYKAQNRRFDALFRGIWYNYTLTNDDAPNSLFCQMLTPAKIHTDNIKDRSDAYLCTALVNIYTDGNIEYMALIEDGSKPRPYIDRQTLAVIWPPGRSKTIIKTATSWRDALEQLQAIADEYGTLAGGVFAVPLVYTTGDLNDDI